MVNPVNVDEKKRVRRTKVAHAKTDDTTVRSIKRHLKSRQKMRDAAINYRLLKGV